MDKIISSIKDALINQRLSETKVAKLAGLPQKTVNNLLAGRTKRLDPNVVEKIKSVLGLQGDLWIDKSTASEPIGERYSPEVKLAADYLEVKIKGKTSEERLKIVEEIMDEIRKKYK